MNKKLLGLVIWWTPQLLFILVMALIVFSSSFLQELHEIGGKAIFYALVTTVVGCFSIYLLIATILYGGHGRLANKLGI
ncbi:MAG: hypothetical protein RSD49_16370 [Hafnia sp.]